MTIQIDLKRHLRVLAQDSLALLPPLLGENHILACRSNAQWAFYFLQTGLCDACRVSDEASNDEVGCGGEEHDDLGCARAVAHGSDFDAAFGFEVFEGICYGFPFPCGAGALAYDA